MLVPPDYFLQPALGDGRGTDGRYYSRAWRICDRRQGFTFGFGDINGVDIKFRDRIDAELAIMGLIQAGVKDMATLRLLSDQDLLRAVTLNLRW